MCQVNGIEVGPGAEYPGFKITENGKYLAFESDGGLIVNMDGATYVSVEVPGNIIF